jgi:hypothetical protein
MERFFYRPAGALSLLLGLVFCYLVLRFGLSSDSVIAPTPTNWQFVIGGSVFGLLFLAGGIHFLRLDPNSEGGVRQNHSRISVYLQAHRNQLRMVAQVGVGVSLIRFAAACAGVSWRPWCEGALGMGAVALGLAALRWDERPDQPARASLTTVALYGVALLMGAIDVIDFNQIPSDLHRLARPTGIVVLYILDVILFSQNPNSLAVTKNQPESDQDN